MSPKNNTVAKVAHVLDEYKVVINRGSDQGVKIGDTYLVYTIGPDIIDPETKESLGPLEIVRGRTVVRHVQEKLSTLETTEVDEIPGRRKIIKRDGNSGVLAASLGFGMGSREEIEEGPERSKRPLDASQGDFAKLLTSKS